MALYEITITVDIDETQLAVHDGDKEPPPNNIREWYSSDLETAYNKGMLSFENEEVASVRKL